MFENYFFVPANNLKLLEKSGNIKGIDYRIFDFEDSVLAYEIDESINLILKVEKKTTDWIRLPFDKQLSRQITKVTSSIGYNNYVIPKFEGLKNLKSFIEGVGEFNASTKYILLIENSKSLLELKEIIQEYANQIVGIALGSHDFSLSTGIENNIYLLRQIRINVLIICKAFGIEAIDVASMNISNEEELESEILDGFKCGYRSKLILHPRQLKILNETQFYSKAQINEYNDILKYYNLEIKEKHALFKYKGTIYEKMHIEQMKIIVKWGGDYYGTDRQIL